MDVSVLCRHSVHVFNAALLASPQCFINLESVPPSIRSLCGRVCHLSLLVVVMSRKCVSLLANYMRRAKTQRSCRLGTWVTDQQNQLTGAPDSSLPLIIQFLNADSAILFHIAYIYMDASTLLHKYGYKLFGVILFDNFVLPLFPVRIFQNLLMVNTYPSNYKFFLKCCSLYAETN